MSFFCCIILFNNNKSDEGKQKEGKEDIFKKESYLHQMQIIIV